MEYKRHKPVDDQAEARHISVIRDDAYEGWPVLLLTESGPRRTALYLSLEEAAAVEAALTDVLGKTTPTAGDDNAAVLDRVRSVVHSWQQAYEDDRTNIDPSVQHYSRAILGDLRVALGEER